MNNLKSILDRVRVLICLIMQQTTDVKELTKIQTKKLNGADEGGVELADK